MATKDSEELKSDERYPLGDYSFRIERSSVPGSTNDKIEAICTDKDGKNARKSIQVPSSTQFSGWYVEANGTEATVYAVIKPPSGEGHDSSELLPGIPVYPTDGHYIETRTDIDDWIEVTYTGAVASAAYVYGGYYMIIIAGYEPFGYTWKSQRKGYREYSGSGNVTGYFTHNDKKAYNTSFAGYTDFPANKTTLNHPYTILPNNHSAGEIAWTLLYGTYTPPSTGDEKEVIIGRFAIELEDAGGVGPGSDWTDPGDYDPDWEPEDPTHTLYVEVTGALSGRHNDPIEDPSYSYIPADKDTVKDYGCGGDGGHGGGGGAGASTVVIHKFATNQANNKEVTAIARRHGYGSGGGKGGKGGDGCILVYY